MPLHEKRLRFAHLMTEDAHWLHAKMLRSGEVALLLQVSRRTVTDWARAGILPFIVTPGGHRRFRAGDVRELADEMRATLVQQPPRQIVQQAPPPASEPPPTRRATG